MPSVDRKSLRELNLTSSFVAGGYCHHYHSGTLLAFFRFEGFPGGTDGRRHGEADWNQSIVNPPYNTDGSIKTGSAHPACDIVFDSAYFLTGTGVVLSGNQFNTKPAYTTNTPYRYHNYFPEKNWYQPFHLKE